MYIHHFIGFTFNQIKIKPFNTFLMFILNFLLYLIVFHKFLYDKIFFVDDFIDLLILKFNIIYNFFPTV